MLTLALITPSLAYAIAAPCMTPTVSQVQPAAGDTGVPTDIAPVAMVVDGGCLLTEQFTVSLYDTTGGAEVLVVEQDFTWSGAAPGEVLLLEPEADLAPDSPHLLRIVPTSGEMSEVAFTTGTGQVEGSSGDAPGLEPVEATWSRSNGAYTVYEEWTLTPQADPDGLGWVQWRDADGVAVQASFVSGTSPVTLWRAYGAEARPDQTCARVTQLDGAARPSAVAEQCVEVQRSGCSTAPGPRAGAALAPLALLLAVLRRNKFA